MAIRRYFWPMLIGIGFWLPAVSWAATITTEPIIVSAGEVELASVSLSLVGAELITLSLTPTGFTDPSQVLTYTWQESKYGTTWVNWTGGEVIGGTHLDETGTPITSFTMWSTSQFVGVMHIRLTGTYTGADITLATAVTY